MYSTPGTHLYPYAIITLFCDVKEYFAKLVGGQAVKPFAQSKHPRCRHATAMDSELSVRFEFGHVHACLVPRLLGAMFASFG